MHDTRPIAPMYSSAGTLVASVTITGTNANATSGALPGNAYGHGDFNQIQIANTTTAWAYVNFARNASELVAATVAAGYPVAPGGVVVVTVADEVSQASVILGAAPGSLTGVIFTRGTGT